MASACRGGSAPTSRASASSSSAVPRAPPMPLRNCANPARCSQNPMSRKSWWTASNDFWRSGKRANNWRCFYNRRPRFRGDDENLSRISRLTCPDRFSRKVVSSRNRPARAPGFLLPGFRRRAVDGAVRPAQGRLIAWQPPFIEVVTSRNTATWKPQSGPVVGCESFQPNVRRERAAGDPVKKWNSGHGSRAADLAGLEGRNREDRRGAPPIHRRDPDRRGRFLRQPTPFGEGSSGNRARSLVVDVSGRRHPGRSRTGKSETRNARPARQDAAIPEPTHDPSTGGAA